MLLPQIHAQLQAQQIYHLRRLINATGVIVHTNLGRSFWPQPPWRICRKWRNRTATWNTICNGASAAHATRTWRQHYRRLTGAEAALVVNNNAAAVFLALQALAAGREVIVSRGQLIEIGGAFRIPDIMRSSGAILREVGSDQ